MARGALGLAEVGPDEELASGGQAETFDTVQDQTQTLVGVLLAGAEPIDDGVLAERRVAAFSVRLADVDEQVLQSVHHRPGLWMTIFWQRHFQHHLPKETSFSSWSR